MGQVDSTKDVKAQSLQMEDIQLILYSLPFLKEEIQTNCCEMSKELQCSLF